MSVFQRLVAHPRAWTAARWVAGIAVLALLVVGLDSGETMARIRAANGLLVVAGVLGLSAVHMLAAASWRVLCRQLGGLRLAWTTCLRVYYSAQALGGVTPANVGGDAYRVMLLHNAGLGWSAAFAPVLVQRATSHLALSLLAFPALGWLAISSQVPLAILGLGLGLCALAGGVAMLLLAAPARLVAIHASLPWNRASDSGAQAVERPAARAPIGSVAVATCFALAFHALSVLLTGLLVVAVDPSVVGISVLAAIVVARLSLAVPILPSGLGANEAIFSLLFVGLGLAPQTALAAMLLTRVALVLTTALGAGLLLSGQPGIPRRGPDPVTAAAGSDRA